ncbi:MAG: hypothetical protein MRQ10_05420, partial [Candidatus Midichloria mitochondrii]|nr:hypothetical protein [Candidatus Midichloria mitochondrii]
MFGERCRVVPDLANLFQLSDGCFNQSTPCKKQLFKSRKPGFVFHVFLKPCDELNTLIAQCFCLYTTDLRIEGLSNIESV